MNSCKTGLNKFFFFSAIFTWILRGGFACFLLACRFSTLLSYPPFSPFRARDIRLISQTEGASIC